MITRRNALAGGLALAGLPIIGKTSPVKSMLGANSSSQESDTSPAHTARDYVQDGLVALYDGIENAGWDTHDNNAEVWTNLMGTTGWNLPNCFSWQNNCFDLTADAVDAINGSSLSIRSASQRKGSDTQATIEMVFAAYNVRIGGTAQMFGFCFDGNNRRVVSFDSPYSGYWSDTNTSGLRPWVGASNTGLNTSLLGYSPNWFNGIHAAISYDSGVGTVYFNGIEVCTLSNTATTYTVSLAMGNGKRSGFTAIPKKNCGKYFRCSYYSRALTADEIAYNYSIDKARFKLP